MAAHVKQDPDLGRIVSRAVRRGRAVKQDLLQSSLHSSVHVAEVFSNPGKTCAAQSLGLTRGMALDLPTGWALITLRNVRSVVNFEKF